jgi:hypothetical protein
MYEEKEKNGKPHPFAGQLRPTEEVLWLSVPSQPGSSFLYQAGLYGVMLLVVAGIIGFSVLSDKSLKTEEQIKIVSLAVGATAVVIVVILLVRGLYGLLTRNRPPERAYAVTNERLLYRNKKNVSSIPLEHVPSVSLFLGDGDKGTFSFGALFPMWPDVEDAIRIKHLIDDAQKKRMQKL